MAAFRLQIASMVLLIGEFPRHSTFARYGDLIAGVGGRTIRGVRQSWEPPAEFPLFEIEHCIFAKRNVLCEEVVEVIRT